MEQLVRLYRRFNVLSLDVAAGAMVGALFFAQLFDVLVLPQGILSLGLAVWIIYTADHLLDAYRIRERAATERHRFHQRHFKALLFFLVAAAMGELILVFFLRKPIFYSGLWLAAAVGVYILISRWLVYFKEVMGALLYSSGVLLPVFSFHQGAFRLADKLMILQFALIAFANLILFSWMDYEKDLKDSHHSLITKIHKRTGAGIFSGVLLVFAIACAGTLSYYPIETMLFIGMMLVLLLLFVFHTYFREEDRFRLAGDAIFFLPAVVLWLK